MVWQSPDERDKVRVEVTKSKSLKTNMIVSFNEMLQYLLIYQSCFGNCNSPYPIISLHDPTLCGVVLFMWITVFRFTTRTVPFYTNI
jgi:hypothetical protein